MRTVFREFEHWELGSSLITCFPSVWRFPVQVGTHCCSLTSRYPHRGTFSGRKIIIITPWLYSASELDRPSDRRLFANLVLSFAEREGCCVVSAAEVYGRILGSQDRSRNFLFQVAPQLYSRGWVHPVPDPLLLRKSGSAGNRTRTCGSVARNSDH
jgi:hypothetical protein